jgi:hypothetical protein
MAIEKLEKINGTCQLMNAVDNPIDRHVDLGRAFINFPLWSK